MPSETLLQLMEEPPATLPSAAEPDQPAEDDAADRARSLSLQERRILAARDINSKIESLELHMERLTATIAQRQSALRDVMDDLQNRSALMLADMMRVSSRLEKDRLQQTERNRVMDMRLTGSVTELGRELDATAAMLAAQKTCLDRLQDSHDTLQRLHLHLEKAVSRQGQSLGLLAADTYQQLSLTRTQIEDLNALYREQQEALLALSSDHELLALKSGQVEARLAGLNSVLNESIGQTRRRFRTVTVVIAVLAAISLGLIAYFQLYPSAVPETVRQQLSGLASGLSQQSSSHDALRQELAAIQERLAALDGILGRQAAEIAGLRAQARQSSRNLRGLQAEVSTLKASLVTESPAEPPEAPVDGVTLPLAVPGTRAGF